MGSSPTGSIERIFLSNLMLFMLLLFSFFLRETLSPTLLLQSKSVRHGADLLSHAILYWIEFRVFCFALSRIGIIYKNKKKKLQDAASIIIFLTRKLSNVIFGPRGGENVILNININ